MNRREQWNWMKIEENKGKVIRQDKLEIWYEARIKRNGEVRRKRKKRGREGKRDKRKLTEKRGEKKHEFILSYHVLPGP